VDPAFISRYCALQEALTICFVSTEKLLAGTYISSVYESFVLAPTLCGTAKCYGWYGELNHDWCPKRQPFIYCKARFSLLMCSAFTLLRFSLDSPSYI
jgi:hypothetical protein